MHCIRDMMDALHQKLVVACGILLMDSKKRVVVKPYGELALQKHASEAYFLENGKMGRLAIHAELISVFSAMHVGLA